MPAPNFCFALLTIAVAFLIAAVVNRSSLDDDQLNLRVELAEDGASVVVYREGRGESILTQNAAQNFRPFLHPIMSPDGISEVTEFSPESIDDMAAARMAAIMIPRNPAGIWLAMK